jgi:hypothetical protein
MAKAKKWVRNVKTVSTYPPKDLFTRDAQTIINRAGKSLSMTRKRELEKAKRILQKKKKSTNKRATR